MAYNMKPEQAAILERAFLDGKSSRAAARLAGVTKNTALHYRLRNGGLEGYRKRGAQFKQNRWK